MLLALAVTPAMLETEAVYCPPDSSTLPEYCFPPTVIEKLIACISAALLLALAAGAAWACALLACAAGVDRAVLAGDELGDALADAGAEAGADGETVACLETTTGFKIVAGGAADRMLVSCMALSSSRDEDRSSSNRPSADSSFALGRTFSFLVMAQTRRQR